jgi:hypothetical protein
MSVVEASLAPAPALRFTPAQMKVIDEEADHLSEWYARVAKANPLDMTDGQLGRFARIRAGVAGQAALKLYLGSPLEEIRSSGSYDRGVDELIVTKAGEVWTCQVKTSTKRPKFYYRRPTDEHTANMLVQAHQIDTDLVELCGWLQRHDYDRLEHQVPVGSKMYPGLELRYFQPMPALWDLVDRG